MKIAFFLWAILQASPVTSKPVRVTANRLDILARENKAIYSGNATALREETVIRCDTLTVFYGEGQTVSRIEADGAVEVKDGSRVAKGEHAEFDNLTGVLVMTGNPEAFDGPTRVTGTQVKWTVGKELIEVEDAKTLMEEAPVPGQRQRVFIQAPRLSIFGKSRRAIWTGRVRATRGDAVFLAEKVVAHYDDTQQLTRVEAIHNVQVTEKKRWAKGDYADFDNRTGILVMTGNPQAREGNNILRGTKVTFHVGSDVLEVENAESVLENPKPLKVRP